MTEEEEFLKQWQSAHGGAASTDGAPAPAENTPAPEKTEEELFLDNFMASRDTPESAPAPAAPTERKPRFLEKAVDRMQLGISDAMSTMAGDTYGRGGAGATERTPVSPLWRPFSAAATQINAAADVVGEGIMGVDEAIGSPLSRTMAAMSENQSQHPIYAKAGLGQAQADLKEAFPEQYPAIAEAATIATAVTPYAKGARYSGGTKAVSQLPKKKTELRRVDIEDRWALDNPFGEQGKVTETGILKTSRHEPGEYRAQMYDDLETIDKLDPRESPGNNFNVVDDAAEDLRMKLDKDLRLEEYMEVRDVNNAILENVTEAAKTPTLSGAGPLAAAESVYEGFTDILKKHEVDGQIKPGRLLQARRDLDTWLRKTKPKIFTAEAMSGQSIAVEAIRDAINGQVAKAVPKAEVAESLRKQSSLLRARDEIMPKANRQGGNRISRAIQETQERTGLAMPHSPAAVGANLQAVPLVIGGGLAASTAFGRAGKAGLRQAIARAKQVGEGVYNVGRGPLTLAAARREEEENR